MFEKYEKRSFDVLDVQSRFLAKLSIEVMENRSVEWIERRTRHPRQQLHSDGGWAELCVFLLLEELGCLLLLTLR